MINKFFQVREYISYLFRSFHLHGIHSPFVYKLNEAVFKEKTPFYCFEEIESVRAKLILTDQVISVNDLGAGSKKTSSAARKISEIAKTSLKRKKHGQLLYRLAYYFKPNIVLELGTSFGISTAYLAKASPKAKVSSIEGATQIAKVAEINFKKLEIKNINQVVANFDDVLESELKSLKKLDFVFFDGNHRKEPTLRYFVQCLEYADDNSVFIFDDIYWSPEMKKAWMQIKQHPKVSITVDCFEMGLVFFKKEQAKQNFTVYH